MYVCVACVLGGYRVPVVIIKGHQISCNWSSRLWATMWDPNSRPHQEQQVLLHF